MFYFFKSMISFKWSIFAELFQIKANKEPFKTAQPNVT